MKIVEYNNLNVFLFYKARATSTVIRPWNCQPQHCSKSFILKLRLSSFRMRWPLNISFHWTACLWSYPAEHLVHAWNLVLLFCLCLCLDLRPIPCRFCQTRSRSFWRCHSLRLRLVRVSYLLRCTWTGC